MKLKHNLHNMKTNNKELKNNSNKREAKVDLKN